MLNKNGETSSLFLISHCLETVRKSMVSIQKPRQVIKVLIIPGCQLTAPLVVEWGDFLFNIGAI